MEIESLLLEIENCEWLEKANSIISIFEETETWAWLPTTRDQKDPFDSSGNSLMNSKIVKLVYKKTLISLRKIDASNYKLIDGPHNYTEAFKGAALYTFRKAVLELSQNEKGPWYNISRHYLNGYWPYGLTSKGKILCI